MSNDVMADNAQVETKPKPPVRAKVFIIYTGGTIGMVPSDPNNTASPLIPANKESLEPFIRDVEKEGIYWEIGGLTDKKGNPVPPLDSSNVNHEHWVYMAEAIEDKYDDVDGFVVLHGTDTMAYTASGLSFLLANLAKPVVITGSQLPIFQLRSDAIQNLVNAIYIAGYKATGLPLVPEVTICFADSLLRGNRTTKVSTTSMRGFDSPNYPRLGEIGEHIRINTDLVRPPANNEQSPFYIHRELNANVMDIGIFPGLGPKQLKTVLKSPDLEGVVLRTFGAGNAPSDPPEFVSVIGDSIDSGKVVLNVTQCVQGGVEMGLYEASSGLLERGVISGMDMTAEAALAKMMWILVTEKGHERQTQLQIGQRGEQSENLFDVRYPIEIGPDKAKPVISESASPAGQFRKAALNRAMLRVAGVGFKGLADDEVLEVRIFVNLPGANESTSTKVPQYAGSFNYQESQGTTIMKDITTTVKRVVEDGRPIYINIVPVGDHPMLCKGLFLALFAKAE